MTTNNPHRVEISIATDGDIEAKFHCDAEVGADCRMWCDQGCETVSDNHRNYHELHEMGFCGRTEGWFDEDPLSLYDGPRCAIRSGRVLLSWEGDYYLWSYDPTPRIGDTVQVGDKTGTISGFSRFTQPADAGLLVEVFIPHDEEPAPHLTPTLADLPR